MHTLRETTFKFDDVALGTYTGISAKVIETISSARFIEFIGLRYGYTVIGYVITTISWC